MTSSGQADFIVKVEFNIRAAVRWAADPLDVILMDLWMYLCISKVKMYKNDKTVRTTTATISIKPRKKTQWDLSRRVAVLLLRMFPRSLWFESVRKLGGHLSARPHSPGLLCLCHQLLLLPSHESDLFLMVAELWQTCAFGTSSCSSSAPLCARSGAGSDK